MAREHDVSLPMLDKSGKPINPDDAEAVADYLMAEAGVVFGKSSSIFTEKQMAALNRRRKDVSLEDVYGYDLADYKFRNSQQLLDLVRDELKAGLIVGIDTDQREILYWVLKGWSYREISEIKQMSLNKVAREMNAIRAKIQRRGSNLWIWLTIAEVFGLSISVVRDELI